MIVCLLLACAGTCTTSTTCCLAAARLGNCPARLEASKVKSGAISRPNRSYSRCVCCGGSSCQSFRPHTFTDLQRSSSQFKADFSPSVGARPCRSTIKHCMPRSNEGTLNIADVMQMCYCCPRHQWLPAHQLKERSTSACSAVVVPFGPKYTNR